MDEMTNSRYLDERGLNTLINKIKADYVNKDIDLSMNSDVIDSLIETAINTTFDKYFKEENDDAVDNNDNTITDGNDNTTDNDNTNNSNGTENNDNTESGDNVVNDNGENNNG